jgi:LPS sulfotransferase NodH
MLDGIDTGYEGKFDFPGGNERPEIAYMLATVPRTGSTYFSHLLWRTGCLGAPLEYLNFDEGHYAFARSSTDLQQSLWRSVLRRRTSPNGVFGFKAFPMQLQALHEGNPALLSSVMSLVDPKRVLYLARRDRIAHIVSYARASLSGIWRKEQEEGSNEPLEYSQTAIETAERWLDLQTAAWEAMFRDLQIAPLRLWYEDVVARPEEIVLQVADHLGVAIAPGPEVRVPEVLKQREGESRSWVERYAESKGTSPATGGDH